MPKKPIFIIFLLAFLLLVFPNHLQAEPTTEPSPEPTTKPFVQHIFIISVDGLNYEGYMGVNCSNLKHIASEGVKDEKSLALKVDTIEAAQASLLTGTFPEEHKFITKNDKVQVESLFDILKKQGKSFAIIDSSGEKLKALSHSNSSYVKAGANLTDSQVLAKAYDYFEKNRTYLTFIYLQDCKENLLKLDEKAYYSSVKSLDQGIGDFVAKLRKENLYYNSLIIVTAPRSSSPSNLVPLIIKGPGCKRNIQTSGSVVLDILPTINKISGLPKPYNARGIPIYDALEVLPSENEYLLKKWVAELKSERIRSLNNYYSMEDELSRTKHQVASIREEKQNVFEFLGEKEEAISKLKLRLSWERILYLAIFILMLAGYYAEYLILKKRFLLFK